MVEETKLVEATEDGEEVRGCRALCNKLPRPALQFLAKFVWFICTARSLLSLA